MTAIPQQTHHAASAPLSAANATYQPSILDLSLGVARPWPTFADVALAVAAWAAHPAFADDFYTLPAIVCCGFEGAVLVLLALRYVRVRPHRLPWVELLFAVHYTQFGLPIFYEPVAVGIQGTIAGRDSFEFASYLALSAGAVLIAAFAFTRRTIPQFGNRLFPPLTPALLSSAAPIHFVAAALVLLACTFVPSVRLALGPILNLLQLLLYYGPFILVPTVAYLTNKGWRNAFLMAVAFAVTAIAVTYTSMLSEMAVPFAGAMVLWWRGRERLPWAFLAIAFAGLLVLQPAKYRYRAIAWRGEAGVSVLDAWHDALSDTMTASQSAFASPQSHGIEATVDRLGELSELAYVVQVVPDSVPHGDGAVYSTLLTALIPRALWPDKPNMTAYALNRFTIALGLTTPEIADTSTCGITLVDQGYYEHGVLGSIGWMALFGALLGLLSRYFPTSLAGSLVGTCLMAPLALAVQGGFFNVFGGLAQNLFGATSLAWLLWTLGRIRHQGP